MMAKQKKTKQPTRKRTPTTKPPRLEGVADDTSILLARIDDMADDIFALQIDVEMQLGRLTDAIEELANR